MCSSAKSMDDNRRMAMRALSFIVWAVVAASIVFWLTRLATRPAQAPAHAVVAGQAAVAANADLSRVLGATRMALPADDAAPEPSAGSRFKLVGVVAARSRPPQAGLALIAVDGKAPKPIETGGVVDGSLVLLAVNHRRAEIGPAGGSPTVTLELPAVPEANRSVRAAPMSVLPVNPALPSMPTTPQVPPQAVPPALPQTAPPPLPPLPGVPRNNPPETR